MQKIIKIDKKVIAMFDDGSSLERDDVSEDLFNQIVSADTQAKVISLMVPSYTSQMKEIEEVKNLISTASKSKILSFEDDCIYWKEVSGLSVPKDFAETVLEAERNNDKLKLESYKNFWTLMSLNPDEECRNNLYWFLNKWGLKIAKCGFFVAYRNADYLETEEDGTKVFTDHHSHTTRIKIGEMVTLDRNKCDSNSNVSCSKGLHAGGAGWLKKNYFGEQGFVVLINPVDVVAVPHDDSYGKLRTCAYLPIALASFDLNGNIIPLNEKDGFDCSYVTKVIYEGLMGTEKDSTYKINIPDIPSIVKDTITDNLLDIAMKCIVNKEV